MQMNCGGAAAGAQGCGGARCGREIFAAVLIENTIRKSYNIQLSNPMVLYFVRFILKYGYVGVRRGVVDEGPAAAAAAARTRQFSLSLSRTAARIFNLVAFPSTCTSNLQNER
jgi:hypothetical protein